MEEFCVLILVAFFITMSLDKAESVQSEELEELPLQTFDELFVDEWWDKDEAAEDLKTPAPTNFGQNVHHQIDRQNTQIGQFEPNSTDQLGQIEPNSTDQNPPLTESDHPGQNEPNSTDQNPPLTESDLSGQIEPNSTDQNPLTESDHSEKIEPNSTDQNPPLTESDHSDNANSSENIAEEERKRKIIDKFHEMKDEFKQKGKYSTKEWVKIERKMAKHLKISRKKIYKWKKEFGISRKMFNEKEDRKHLIEKFDQMKAELKRGGFKSSYKNELDKTVAKELGLSFITIYSWKRKLGQTAPNKYPHIEQKELMKLYYEIKDENPKISDENIAKMLKIGRDTLRRWKKQFKRQQFHPNSVDVQSAEVTAAANSLEIENSNSGSI